MIIVNMEPYQCMFPIKIDWLSIQKVNNIKEGYERSDSNQNLKKHGVLEM
jgi:hypothetical protein